MASLRRAALTICAIVALGVALPLVNPSPPKAEASALPCLALGSAQAVIGAVGFGNAASDACDAVTDPVLGVAGKVLDPLKDAASSIGKSIFNQVTAWVADGAVWLIGEVARLTEKTTTPDLLSNGFLRQYRQMASIAALLAALVLIFAVLDALARGDGGTLGRVFLIHVPLAAIATTTAYVVVQLLVSATDGMSEVVARSTGEDAHRFFQGAVTALAAVGAGVGGTGGAVTGGSATGAAAGAAGGAVAVPLFVGFIAAIVAAFAAFLVWIELLMRDAAIYVVALFMPLALAASIAPRWGGTLRRSCELVIVVVLSKFVIVAIIALAASLLARNEGSVEQILAASAMLLLACFAPFVLLRLVLSAEGAMSATLSRRGASAGAARTVEASSMQMMRRAASTNWSGGGKGDGKAGGGGASGGGKSKGVLGGAGGASGKGGIAAAGAGAAMGAVLTAGLGAAKSVRSAGGRLSKTGVAETAGGSGEGSPTGGGGSGSGGDGGTARPSSGESGAPRKSGGAGSPPKSADSSKSSAASDSGAATPKPSEAPGGKAGRGAEPPRPSASGGTADGKAGKS